jgi:hypothetical protein
VFATIHGLAAACGARAAFRDRLVALDVHPVAIHASYLVNLAGPEGLLRSLGRGPQ